ncbi:MAG: hypothetical protein RLZZ379_221, partial [Pseudomonadota bacterium]
ISLGGSTTNGNIDIGPTGSTMSYGNVNILTASDNYGNVNILTGMMGTGTLNVGGGAIFSGSVNSSSGFISHSFDWYDSGQIDIMDSVTAGNITIARQQTTGALSISTANRSFQNPNN